MSVIWSGITEEGAVVPVQVTEEGKVVAVSDGPVGDYLPITGGELTGDLEVDGSITAASNINNGTFLDSGGGSTGVGVRLDASGQISCSRAQDASPLFKGYSSAGLVTSSINGDGSITAAGDVKIGDTSVSNINLSADGSSRFYGDMRINRRLDSSFNNVSLAIDNADAAGVITLNNNGSITAAGGARFLGDVIIGSRGSQWLIRESNGVAMLIEQTRSGPEPRMQKVRDLPNELDLIETALSEVMAKLKMVPPAGWPVWDGQDEVNSDNDNA